MILKKKLCMDTCPKIFMHTTGAEKQCICSSRGKKFPMHEKVKQMFMPIRNHSPLFKSKIVHHLIR